jgi:hypothetical protein
MGKMRNAYNILVGKPRGKRQLSRHRLRWENNILMDIREIGFEGLDWIHMAQDRYRWGAFVTTVMSLWVL